MASFLTRDTDLYSSRHTDSLLFTRSLLALPTSTQTIAQPASDRGKLYQQRRMHHRALHLYRRHQAISSPSFISFHCHHRSFFAAASCTESSLTSPLRQRQHARKPPASHSSSSAHRNHNHSDMRISPLATSLLMLLSPPHGSAFQTSPTVTVHPSRRSLHSVDNGSNTLMSGVSISQRGRVAFASSSLRMAEALTAIQDDIHAASSSPNSNSNKESIAKGEVIASLPSFAVVRVCEEDLVPSLGSATILERQVASAAQAPDAKGEDSSTTETVGEDEGDKVELASALFGKIIPKPVANAMQKVNKGHGGVIGTFVL